LYEEGGYDYPLGQVRWTEGRNLESFVDLLASGKLDVHPLISHRFPIDVAGEAYDLITGKKQEPFLGVLLTYPDSPNGPPVSKRVIFHTQAAPVTGKIRIGVLGAGNYASAVFLPAIKKVGGVTLVGIGSSSGLSARHAGGQYGFSYATSDETQIIDDPSIQLVVVLTRHNSHARQIQAALTAGKAVYCEKPLAISEEQLAGIERLLETPELPLLTVGFNRRFAPFAQKLLGFLGNSSQPMYIHYRINAGFIPLTHWLHDPLVGGGRIIGEACHFIDFLTYLTGQVPTGVTATALPDGGIYRQDNVTMTFDYPDGSIGTVTYLANGDKSFPKERVEVFCGGKVAVLDDFRSLSLTNAGRTTRHQSRLSQDKGHAHAWQAFLQAVQSGGEPTIPYHQLLGVTRATLAVMESLRDGSRKAIG
jgi:predicted dehydrogenase